MKKLYFQTYKDRKDMFIDRAFWAAQVFLALLFLSSGSSKLARVDQVVALFDQIGVGTWFRYSVGAIEILSASLLLIPQTAALGGVLLVITMVGATAIHLFVVGGSPIAAIMLATVAALVAYKRRCGLKRLFSKPEGKNVSFTSNSFTKQELI